MNTYDPANYTVYVHPTTGPSTVTHRSSGLPSSSPAPALGAGTSHGASGFPAGAAAVPEEHGAGGAQEPPVTQNRLPGDDPQSADENRADGRGLDSIGSSDQVAPAARTTAGPWPQSGPDPAVESGVAVGSPGTRVSSASPARAEAGDRWIPPSWEQVVREHSARVHRLAYRLSGNAQDAEDLTQETFVRVFRSLADYSPGTFEGWLHRITTNLFLDMVRRRQRIHFVALPEDPDRLSGDAPSPEQVYADTHLDPQVQAALDALKPEFRVAVILCDIEGLTYEEIAATRGVKLGTVRSRIHRGRTQLREALDHLRPRSGWGEVSPGREYRAAS